MGSTLDTIRTGALNIELGLDDDSDNRFGTTVHRNHALTEAFRRLWPRMARLTDETLTIVDDQTEYTLSSLRQVEYLELRDSEDRFVTRLTNWRTWTEDTTTRLLLPQAIDSSLSVIVVGWAQYTIPSSGSGTSTMPADLEWIVVQGGRALLYRRLLNQFAVFERHENENRKTFLTVEQVITMEREAEGMFQAAINDNRRSIATPRKAISIR
jgi:hypothetical protein